MKRFFPLLILILLITQNNSELFGKQYKTVNKVLRLMGTRFELIAVDENDTLAWKAIQAGIREIKRIENLISSWDPKSETSEINRNAGIKPVIVNRELFELIKRSKKISELTNGAFDISFESIHKIWKYDGSMTKVPTKKQMQESISKINYKNILLNEKDNSVFLKDNGMKIGFGAIGKGYAANRARTVMKNFGIKNGVINAAGDLTTWGKQEDGKEWTIGITDPNNKNKTFAWLLISELAVVTSGNYEKFAEINGKRYGHIINPKTGYPVGEIKSVTIICPDAEIADALATSVFVLGEKKGFILINKLKNIECVLINNENKILSSNNIKLKYFE